MQRFLALSLFAAACQVPAKSATTTKPAAPTESEWRAAADLATTLARAAGAERLAPAIRVQAPGTESKRHISLAAGGCYHAGIAWLFDADLDATVTFDTGTSAKPAGDEQHITAPGGALDFCADHAGGATLVFRPISHLGSPIPHELDYAVVFGSARPNPHRVAHR
jgi:hypothetical protein